MSKISVMRKQGETCLASLVGVCPSCAQAFDCPLCPLAFGSAAFSAPGDIHLLDLIFIPVPFVLPPPFEGMSDVVLPVKATAVYTTQAYTARCWGDWQHFPKLSSFDGIWDANCRRLTRNVS